MNGPDQAVPTITGEQLTALRSEIIHAQQMGSDFLKWKLIGAASVASLGLGSGMSSRLVPSDANILICLIPLICAYVDLARLDLVVRVVAIARFLRINGDRYEQFVDELRHSPGKPFRFATIAVHLSSAVMNVLIVAGGWYGCLNGWPPLRAGTFMAVGLVGLLVTLFLWWKHNSVIKKIGNYEPRQQGCSAA